MSKIMFVVYLGDGRTKYTAEYPRNITVYDAKCALLSGMARDEHALNPRKKTKFGELDPDYVLLTINTPRGVAVLDNMKELGFYADEESKMQMDLWIKA